MHDPATNTTPSSEMLFISWLLPFTFYELVESLLFELRIQPRRYTFTLLQPCIGVAIASRLIVYCEGLTELVTFPANVVHFSTAKHLCARSRAVTTKHSIQDLNEDEFRTLGSRHETSSWPMREQFRSLPRDRNGLSALRTSNSFFPPIPARPSLVPGAPLPTESQENQTTLKCLHLQQLWRLTIPTASRSTSPHHMSG